MQYLCGLFGVSRQNWYDHRKRYDRKEAERLLLLSEVTELKKEHPAMAADKLLLLLAPFLSDHKITIGRDAFYNLLRDHDLLVKRKKRYTITTNSDHRFRKYPNLIREVIPLSASEVWLSDITYVRIGEKFGYLSLITDGYSRKIVGYCLYPTLSTEGPLHALNMASENEKIRDKKHNLIHHSDRGIQYCCYAYTTILMGLGVEISMTENGDPYENAIAERVNGILKGEYDLNKTFDSFEDANKAVEAAVYKYNDIRPHRSVEMKTPAVAHLCTGELERKW